jgi:hypothetical protein
MKESPMALRDILPSPAARRSRRLATFSAALAATGLALAGALTPALAATGPALTVNHNSVNMAVPGPNNSLRFYWATNGSPTWHSEKVAVAGTTYSAAAMIVNGNSVNIAAEGPGHSLRFYWATNGSPTWHAEKVAAGGAGYSAPSITVNSGGGNITAQGTGHALL